QERQKQQGRLKMVELSSPIKIYNKIFKEGERQCPGDIMAHQPTAPYLVPFNLPSPLPPSLPPPLPSPPPLLAWQKDVARCKGLRTLDPIATPTGSTKVKQRVNLMDYYDNNDDDDDDDDDDDSDDDDEK
ncbi:hypothetical protein V1478_015771, partial [Vespula squamosa]